MLINSQLFTQKKMIPPKEPLKIKSFLTNKTMLEVIILNKIQNRNKSSNNNNNNNNRAKNNNNHNNNSKKKFQEDLRILIKTMTDNNNKIIMEDLISTSLDFLAYLWVDSTWEDLD